MLSHQPPLTPLPPVRILCDEMLLGLAGWLRIAGYDTRVPDPGTQDPQVVASAVREGRWLITRDRGLLTQSSTPEVVVLLESQGLNANCQELSRRLNLNWLHAPFSRCKRCNTRLIPWSETPQPQGQQAETVVSY
ncbi:MAG: hypothetical protein EA349_00880, partial [Halomonadaceae bacterium]